MPSPEGLSYTATSGVGVGDRYVDAGSSVIFGIEPPSANL